MMMRALMGMMKIDSHEDDSTDMEAIGMMSILVHFTTEWVLDSTFLRHSIFQLSGTNCPSLYLCHFN